MWRKIKGNVEKVFIWKKMLHFDARNLIKFYTFGYREMSWKQTDILHEKYLSGGFFFKVDR